MILTDMISETALILNNMKSAHPWYSKITDVLNRSANEFIRMAIGGNGQNIDLFPRLKNSWTVGPTVSGENVVAQPGDSLVIQTVHRAESATTPDWTQTKELPLSFIPATSFGILSKEATTAGYAKIFSRKGNSILIWPTPTSSYIDHLRMYGLRRETALSSGSDSFYMDEDFHDAVVLLAAQRIASRIGWTEMASSLMGELQQRISQTVNPTALQNDESSATVEDTPTRNSVYGSQ